MGVDLCAAIVHADTREIRSERIKINRFAEQRGIIKDAGSGADNRFSVSFDIPSQSDARREILIIGLPHRRQAAASDLSNGRRGCWIDVRIEIGDVIIALVRTPRIFVTQAKIQSQSWLHTPVVLNETCE